MKVVTKALIKNSDDKLLLYRGIAQHLFLDEQSGSLPRFCTAVSTHGVMYLFATSRVENLFIAS